MWSRITIKSGYQWRQHDDERLPLHSALGATGLVTVNVSNLNSAIGTAAGYEVWVYADPEGLARSESLLVDDGIHAMAASR